MAMYLTEKGLQSKSTPRKTFPTGLGRGCNNIRANFIEKQKVS